MANQIQIGREMNRIVISGDFKTIDTRTLLAVIHKTINEKNFTDLELDFTKCTFADQGAMLPICTHTLNLRNKRIDFDLKLPINEVMRRLFINTGWAHFICPRHYEAPSVQNNSKQIPAFQFDKLEQINDHLNKVLDHLLRIIPHFKRDAFSAVEWSLNEITDNVINHSNSLIGGIFQLSILSRNRIQFTISDSGVGVPTTLREAYPSIQTDMDALMESVKSGVTRNKTDFQGNGLYGTLEVCRVGGGRFILNSGYASLKADASVNTKFEKIPFSGTTIDALVDFSSPELLIKALMINGRETPPADYIEYYYEQDGLQEINFILNNETDSFRSRLAGKPIKNKLANLIDACHGQRIFISFEGVSVISSSFADEVFGRLFVELGPMSFMRTITFVNTNSTIQAIIDRAITLRMQESKKT